MRRVAVTLAVLVPVGTFTLMGVVYWLAFAETVRLTVSALRAPSTSAVEDRRGA